MPAVTGNGLAMRLGMFLEALAETSTIDLIVIPVAGVATAEPYLPQQLGIRPLVLSVEGRRDTQFELLIRLKDRRARLAAFRSYGRSSLAAGVSVVIRDAISQHVAEASYDLVHIGRSYLADAMTAVARPSLTTMDLDEDEGVSRREIAERLRDGGLVFEADWTLAEADAEQKLLATDAKRFDRLFISSAADASSVCARHPQLTVDVVENAVVIPTMPIHQDDGATVLFIGSFGYGPNVDAMKWFVQGIWPQVRAASSPAPRLLIAGRDITPELAALDNHDGIEVVGAVNDVGEAYTKATIVVAPLRAGAGTRVKLIEAAAYGVPIVSTALAARGLGLFSPAMLWLADDAKTFADAIVEALNSPRERAVRAERAARFVSRHHDRRQVADVLAEKFDMLLSGAGRRG